MDLLTAEHVTKRYAAHTALDDVSLAIPKGSVYGLLGPNGAGKTTTPLMLLGLTEPTAGSATIEGVDLVTEGVITINRVLTYAESYLADNKFFADWSYKRDGASLIARMLFEEATDINFFVGRAVNPAHQNPDLPINFSIKMRLVDGLSEALRKMGKRIKVSYF